MNKSWTMDRRTLLRAAGNVTVALPFLDVMARPGRAQAAAPKRLWVSFSPNGVVHPQITPQGGERDFTLPMCLQPLQPHRPDLLLVFGLDNLANGRGAPAGGHYGGGPTCLTGETLAPGGNVKGSPDSPGYSAGGVSLDQAIAASPAGATRFRSLTVGHQGTLLVNYLSAAGRGQFVSNEPSAVDLYRKLFSNISSTPMTGGAPSPELVRARAQRGTVLDLVKGELERLNGKVSVDDRKTLDAHFQSIREVERSMDEALKPVGQDCRNPGEPASLVLDGATPNLDKMVPVFVKLEAYAFRCDLTRVITNMWVKSSSRQSYPWIGVPERHHDLSHNSSGAPMEKLAKIDQWWAKVMADTITELKATPEAGKTVFDNTLVVWAHELSNGDNHTSNNIPWIMAGSAGGAFKTGRYLSYAGQGRATNDLLAAIGKGFGLPGDTFGKREFCKGPLPLT